MYFEIIILVVLIIGDYISKLTSVQTGGATDTKKLQAQIDALKADLAKLQRDATLTKAKYQTASNDKIKKIREQIAKLDSNETAKIDKLNDEIQKIQTKYQEAGEKGANSYNGKIDKITGELSDLQDKLGEATEIQDKNDLELLGGIKTDISDPYQHLRLWKIIDWLRGFWLTR
jgi:DNA repair exonuclease SbcCD ATPase subunit